MRSRTFIAKEKCSRSCVNLQYSACDRRINECSLPPRYPTASSQDAHTLRNWLFTRAVRGSRLDARLFLGQKHRYVKSGDFITILQSTVCSSSSKKWFVCGRNFFFKSWRRLRTLAIPSSCLFTFKSRLYPITPPSERFQCPFDVALSCLRESP